MTKRITKARMERIEKEEALFERIFKCAEEIRECEDELSAMGAGDRWSDGELGFSETLWCNFRDPLRERLRLRESLGRYSEDPCYAVAALLERKLLCTPMSGLQARGCTVTIQAKSVQWCISGVLDENTSRQIRVWDEQTPQDK